MRPTTTVCAGLAFALHLLAAATRAYSPVLGDGNSWTYSYRYYSMGTSLRDSVVSELQIDSVRTHVDSTIVYATHHDQGRDEFVSGLDTTYSMRYYAPGGLITFVDTRTGAHPLYDIEIWAYFDAPTLAAGALDTVRVAVGHDTGFMVTRNDSSYHYDSGPYTIEQTEKRIEHIGCAEYFNWSFHEGVANNVILDDSSYVRLVKYGGTAVDINHLQQVRVISAEAPAPRSVGTRTRAQVFSGATNSRGPGTVMDLLGRRCVDAALAGRLAVRIMRD